nr:uncharacterized protein LOC117278376 [Nicotiana tomentosiformis]
MDAAEGANTVADQLAHFGMELMGSNITFLEQPPPFVMANVEADKLGYLRSRHSSSNSPLQPYFKSCLTSDHASSSRTNCNRNFHRIDSTTSSSKFSYVCHSAASMQLSVMHL